MLWWPHDKLRSCKSSITRAFLCYYEELGSEVDIQRISGVHAHCHHFSDVCWPPTPHPYWRRAFILPILKKTYLIGKSYINFQSVFGLFFLSKFTERPIWVKPVHILKAHHMYVKSAYHFCNCTATDHCDVKTSITPSDAAHNFTNWGLVTPYGVGDLCQHWFR